MLKFFFRRQNNTADLSDTPYTEHRDPYLEHIMDEIRLIVDDNPATIKEQLKEKEVK